MHSISWDQICKLIGAGNLDVKKLRVMNVALLAKLGWKMIKFPNLLWARVLRAKYGDPLATVQKREDISQVWRSILASSGVLQEGLDSGTNSVGKAS